MTKIKISVGILAVILTMLFCCSCGSNTVYSSEESKTTTSVYADKTVQDKIYLLLTNDAFDKHEEIIKYELTILKESITPVYTVNIPGSNSSEKIKILPMSNGEVGSTEGNTYTVKLLTKSGEYGGHLIFYVDNDKAICISFAKSFNSSNPDELRSGSYKASTSYADHAEKIRNLLGLDKFVPVENVTFVRINGIGEFFCINAEDTDIFIPIGYHNNNDSSLQMLSADEIRQRYVAYEDALDEYKKQLEEWEKEHPGEKYDETGPTFFEHLVRVSCGDIHNVTNIEEYLSIGK